MGVGAQTRNDAREGEPLLIGRADLNRGFEPSYIGRKGLVQYSEYSRNKSSLLHTSFRRTSDRLVK